MVPGVHLTRLDDVLPEGSVHAAVLRVAQPLRHEDRLRYVEHRVVGAPGGEHGEGGGEGDLTGGGQPGDTGWLRWAGGETRVVDTVKRGGEVLHVLADAAPPVGARVLAEIDWDRRYTLMRTHTALHALSAVVFRDYGAKVTGGNMEPGVARMDFELEAISQEEDAAASVGMNVTRLKLGVTIVSALMTCVGGALYAQYQLYVNPETVSGIGVSLQMVFGAIAGGMFVRLGPTVGAVFTLLLAEALRLALGHDIHGLDVTLYGLMLVLFIIFMPKGILGAAIAALEERRAPKPLPATLTR